MTVRVISDEEAVEVAEMVAELRTHGYVDLPDFNGRLYPGARVAHVGHRWPEAYTDGTGVILALLERPNSPWSADWGARDVEMVVLWDKPWPFDTSSRLSQLAQYHVYVAERQPDAEDRHG